MNEIYFPYPSIPKEVLPELYRLGFVFEIGTIKTKSNYRESFSEYTMRNNRFPVYLIIGKVKTWFYDTAKERFVHPDHIHDHLERLSTKES